jgi:hypothetical protein
VGKVAAGFYSISRWEVFIGFSIVILYTICTPEGLE